MSSLISWVIALGSLFLADLGLCITLTVNTMRKELPLPLRYTFIIFIVASLILITVLSIVIPIIATVVPINNPTLWILGGVVAIILINGGSFLGIFRLERRRLAEKAAKAEQVIDYVEMTFSYFSELDGLICEILEKVKGNGSFTELQVMILNSMDLIMTFIDYLLNLDINHDAHISIYSCVEGGKFKVLKYRHLSQQQIVEIEREFSFVDPPRGLAGHAIHEAATLTIPNLGDKNSSNYGKWLQTYKDQDKDGSIICVPIFRGIEAGEDKVPMGVLNISSRKTNAFESDDTKKLLRRFANKVEMLFYCMELAEDKAKRRPVPRSPRKKSTNS